MENRLEEDGNESGVPESCSVVIFDSIANPIALILGANCLYLLSSDK